MTEIPIYIRLKTDKALEKSDALSWLKLVSDFLPHGVRTSIQTTDPDGNPDVIAMVHKIYKSGEHLYVIPLARDLVDRELKVITDLYQGVGTIEVSAPDLKGMRSEPEDDIVLDDDSYDELCQSLAKYQHQRWYASQAQKGWHLGLTIDPVNKKHPLMRPWEELPDDYKEVDYELPNVFMNLLTAHGFAVVNRADLMKWIKKQR